MKCQIEKLVLIALVAGLTAAPRAALADEAGAITGVTEPVQNIIIKAWGKKIPPWSGRIAKILVKEGQVVEPGQALIEMDKRDEDIELRLRTLLAHDQSEMKTVRERERLLKTLWTINKDVAADNRSVSREDVIKKELDYKSAVGERQRLELADEKAKIDLESAQIAMDNRTVRSPVHGTIVKIHLHEGESSEANDPLVQIVDTSRCLFVCNVEEKIGRGLAEGQSVNLKIQTGGTHENKTGTITFVSPVVESASFLLTVKVEFANPDGKIRPGVPGVMTIPTGQ